MKCVLLQGIVSPISSARMSDFLLTFFGRGSLVGFRYILVYSPWRSVFFFWSDLTLRGATDPPDYEAGCLAGLCAFHCEGSDIPFISGRTFFFYPLVRFP